eukprot:1323379-Amphidinium_carterae.1
MHLHPLKRSSVLRREVQMSFSSPSDSSSLTRTSGEHLQPLCSEDWSQHWIGCNVVGIISA